jgi:hypothetical protein
MDAVNQLIEKLISWVDKIFGYFDFYSANYSKFIVYGGLLFIAAKIFKIKLDIPGRK